MRATVVIPARDERALIARCLESVLGGAVAARVIVVADRCRDDTASIARSYGVEVVEIEAAAVGVARSIGFSLATSEWIATTDADTVVPAQWLTTQLELADAGADVVIGTVRPGADDLDAEQWLAWEASHANGSAIGNVHGANLGFRASAYRAVGGFAGIAEHEDIDLVGRLRDAGFSIAASDRLEVVTSGRLDGRTPGGYAKYLRDHLVQTASEAV